MAFLTAGLGKGPLVTIGLGAPQIIIIKEDFRTQGSGVGQHYKKRVKGIRLEDETKLVILQTLTAKSEIPIDIFKILKITKEEEISILKKIKKMLDHPCEFGMQLITRKDGKININQKFFHKIARPISISGEKIVKFIEKKVNIIENKRKEHQINTKSLNVDDVLSKTEVTDLLDMIDKMEDEDERV